MKPSFLNSNKPLLCVMIQEDNPKDAIDLIQNCRFDGAEAFGIQLECLKREYRNETDLKAIFNACGGLPIYVTSYRNYASTGYTDQDCMDYLKLAAKCGATLCDVMADTFDIQKEGTTFDQNAVSKQKQVINELHALGAEVLMSTHFTDFKDKEYTYNIARAQSERGCDVIKIVNFAHNDEQLVKNLEICVGLKEVSNAKYLYLASGEKGKFIRQTGGGLGACMYLCVYRYGGVYFLQQPVLKSQKLIRDNMVL